MVFPTFCNLAISKLWSEPWSAPGLVFANCLKLLHIFGCKEYNQSNFDIDHLVMSMSRVFSCVVGRGVLLWLVCSLGQTLLAFALLHFLLQGQICLLLQVSLDFLLLHSNALWWKGHLFGVLVLEGLVGLHRTVQLQLLQHYWSGHRLRFCWYCLSWKRTEIIVLFLRVYASTAFQTLLLTMMATPFLLRDSCLQ